MRLEVFENARRRFSKAQITRCVRRTGARRARRHSRRLRFARSCGNARRECARQHQPRARGHNCPNGGTKIEVGLDTNGNGVLDPIRGERVGDDVRLQRRGHELARQDDAEPSGTNCPFGGVRDRDGRRSRTTTARSTRTRSTQHDVRVQHGAERDASRRAPASSRHQAGGVSTSPTDPITVRFTMKDDRGFPVDIKGVYSHEHADPAALRDRVLTRRTRTATSRRSRSTRRARRRRPTAAPRHRSRRCTTRSARTPVTARSSRTASAPATTRTRSRRRRRTPGPSRSPTTRPSSTRPTSCGSRSSRQTDLVFRPTRNTFYAANSRTTSSRRAARATPRRSSPRRTARTATTSSRPRRPRRTRSSTAAAHRRRACATSATTRIAPRTRRRTRGASSTASTTASTSSRRTCSTASPRRTRRTSATATPATRARRKARRRITHPSRAACGSATTTSTSRATRTCRRADSTRCSPRQPTASRCRAITSAARSPTTRRARSATADDADALRRRHGHVAPGRTAGSEQREARRRRQRQHERVVRRRRRLRAGRRRASSPTTSRASTTWNDTTSTPNVKRPPITFKLKQRRHRRRVPTRRATPAHASSCRTSSARRASTSRSRCRRTASRTPADFNASASGYIKDASGTARRPARRGHAHGPGRERLLHDQRSPACSPGDRDDAHRRRRLHVLAHVARRRSSQTNVAGVSAYTAATRRRAASASPRRTCGRSRPASPARRAIVDNTKCNDCHGALGVSADVPRRTAQRRPDLLVLPQPEPHELRLGGGSKYFIHAIHGGRKRTVPFTWHADDAGPGYDEVEFPGDAQRLHDLPRAEHVRLHGADQARAVPNMELTTVATGKYDSNPLTNSTYYTVSPYVVGTNVTDYGAGFASTRPPASPRRRPAPPS